MKAVARDNKITIKLNIKENYHPFVTGDEHYLEKLFLNLVANAVAYGKKHGKVLVTISGTAKEAVVKVEDNGIGISAEDLPQIFERFFRGDKAHTSHASHGNHSGLGLAIAKWAANLHKGKISATSKEGYGSVFTITLPLTK